MNDLPQIAKITNITKPPSRCTVIPPVYKTTLQPRNIFVTHNGPLKMRITRYGDYDITPYKQQKLCQKIIEPKRSNIIEIVQKALALKSQQQVTEQK